MGRIDVPPFGEPPWDRLLDIYVAGSYLGGTYDRLVSLQNLGAVDVDTRAAIHGDYLRVLAAAVGADFSTVEEANAAFIQGQMPHLVTDRVVAFYSNAVKGPVAEALARQAEFLHVQTFPYEPTGTVLPAVMGLYIHPAPARGLALMAELLPELVESGRVFQGKVFNGSAASVLQDRADLINFYDDRAESWEQLILAVADLQQKQPELFARDAPVLSRPVLADGMRLQGVGVVERARAGQHPDSYRPEMGYHFRINELLREAFTAAVGDLEAQHLPPLSTPAESSEGNIFGSSLSGYRTTTAIIEELLAIPQGREELIAAWRAEVRAAAPRRGVDPHDITRINLSPAERRPPGPPLPLEQLTRKAASARTVGPPTIARL